MSHLPEIAFLENGWTLGVPFHPDDVKSLRNDYSNGSANYQRLQPNKDFLIITPDFVANLVVASRSHPESPLNLCRDVFVDLAGKKDSCWARLQHMLIVSAGDDVKFENQDDPLILG